MLVSAARSRTSFRAPVAIFTLLALAARRFTASDRGGRGRRRVTCRAGGRRLRRGRPDRPDRGDRGKLRRRPPGCDGDGALRRPAPGPRRCASSIAGTSPRGRRPGTPATRSTWGSGTRARRGSRTWGLRQFRGWGGSSHPDVTVTPQGFSTEARVPREPEGPRARTDDARLPAGPDPGGRVGGGARRRRGRARERGRRRRHGRAGGSRSSSRAIPAFAAEPYRPARYDRSPPRTAGLVRGRPARPRRALRARRRDHARGVRLRVPAARGRRRGPRFHHALRLRRQRRAGARSAATRATTRAS